MNAHTLRNWDQPLLLLACNFLKHTWMRSPLFQTSSNGLLKINFDVVDVKIFAPSSALQYSNIYVWTTSHMSPVSLIGLKWMLLNFLAVPVVVHLNLLLCSIQSQRWCQSCCWVHFCKTWVPIQCPLFRPWVLLEEPHWLVAPTPLYYPLPKTK